MDVSSTASFGETTSNFFVVVGRMPASLGSGFNSPGLGLRRRLNRSRHNRKTGSQPKT